MIQIPRPYVSDFLLPLLGESGKYMEIKNGFVANPNRFEEMFTTYYPELVIYLCKFVKEKTVAEDIVQETFCELWSKKDTYPISNVRGFLFRSVRNAAVNYLTREKRMTVDLSREIENEIIFQEDLEAIERDRKLYLLIERLPEQRKRIFKLCFFEGLRYQDVADKLNISVNTVKTQMGRALSDLRDSAGELILYFILKKLEKK